MSISIHTPAKGVTLSGRYVRGYVKHFNPHSRKGSDGIKQTGVFSHDNFNPHSRKGSDAACHPTYMRIVHFNPHSRKGSDEKDSARG